MKLTIRDKAKAALWLASQIVKGKFNKKKFSTKKINEKMNEEIDIDNKGKKTNEELIKEKFPDPKWIIEDNT